jgi:hypothetical protein
MNRLEKKAVALGCAPEYLEYAPVKEMVELAEINDICEEVVKGMFYICYRPEPVGQGCQAIAYSVAKEACEALDMSNMLQATVAFSKTVEGKAKLGIEPPPATWEEALAAGWNPEDHDGFVKSVAAWDQVGEAEAVMAE